MIGPGDLRHGLLRRLLDRQLGLLLDHSLDVLDDDDRIVDDDADRQHQGEQRYCVGGIADDQHDREGADHRNRHRDQRDQGGPELAKEEEDDNGHQHEGDDEGADDLGDSVRHEHGVVEEHGVADVVREALLQPFHDLANLARHLDRIGPR